MPRRAKLVAGVVGFFALGSLAGGTDEAHAIPIPVPIPGLGPVISAGTNAISGGIGSAAVSGFAALIAKLFTWSSDLVTVQLLGWLVAVPNYAIAPDANVEGHANSNLAELATTTSSMAFALLAAVGTIACLRYWVAGLSGSGGFEALQGLSRTVCAALFVVAWPWIFRHSADFSNATGKGLLGSGTVLDNTHRMLALAFGGAVALNFFSIVIAIGAAFLFLGLLLCKISVDASTALVFEAMPFAIVAWVIPELGWIARTAMKAFAVVLVIPPAWALCFATFAAVGMDALSLKGAGTAADALIKPLVALALLYITVAMPRSLARMAMLGSHGGGFVSRTVSYVAGRQAHAAISQASHGGHSKAPADSTNAESRSASEHGGATQRAKSAAATGATVGATAVAGPAGTTATAVGTKAAAAKAAPSTGPSAPKAPTPSTTSKSATQPSLSTPSWQEIRDRVPAELDAAKARRSSTNSADVTAAMPGLHPDARRAVRALANAKSGRIEGQMVHQAARSDLGSVEREAFRTLAAATPEDRVRGIREYFTWHESGASFPQPEADVSSPEPSPRPPAAPPERSPSDGSSTGDAQK